MGPPCGNACDVANGSAASAMYLAIITVDDSLHCRGEPANLTGTVYRGGAQPIAVGDAQGSTTGMYHRLLV
jgi:hypothetical protein